MNRKLSGMVLLLCMLLATASAIANEKSAGEEKKIVMERAIEADKAGRYDEALDLFKQAAADGDHKAMTEVGLRYYTGKGVRQDYCAAYEWFNKAKEGDADALNNMGVMFRDGQCVKKNRKIAYLTFLMIHMQGMGTEQTQMRTNRNLRREVAELSRGDVKEALCYTLPYYKQVLESRGKKTKAATENLPSAKSLRFKEASWWLPHEMEGLNYECPKPWNKIRPAEEDPAGAQEAPPAANN